MLGGYKKRRECAQGIYMGIRVVHQLRRVFVIKMTLPARSVDDNDDDAARSPSNSARNSSLDVELADSDENTSVGR